VIGDLLGSDFEQTTDVLEDYAMSLRYNHRTKDYGARFTYEDYGEDFRSDLGFVPRVDFRMAVAGGWYTTGSCSGPTSASCGWCTSSASACSPARSCSTWT